MEGECEGGGWMGEGGGWSLFLVWNLFRTTSTQGMFFILSLAWWIFPQPDFMVVRGGHRKTLIFVLFRMPHFKPALQRALLSFVPFAAACIL